MKTLTRRNILSGRIYPEENVGQKKNEGVFHQRDGWLSCVYVCVRPLTNDIFAPDAAFFLLMRRQCFFYGQLKQNANYHI